MQTSSSDLPLTHSFVDERFDDQDGLPYDKASFEEEYGEDAARLWAAAVPRAFRLGNTTIDLDLAAGRAEVALCDAEDRVLALVLRNADGADGRHLMASASIRLEESDVSSGSAHAMAGPCRTSSLTSGTSITNDNFKTLYNGVARPGSLQSLELARSLVHVVERRRLQGSSCIFVRPEADLECTVRAHAFPPKDPAGAAPPRVNRVCYNAQGSPLMKPSR